MRKSNHPLVGKKVNVTWKDPDCDWSSYIVKHFEYPIICLQGVEQDGDPYVDGPMWVHFDAIEFLIEELPDGS